MKKRVLIYGFIIFTAGFWFGTTAENTEVREVERIVEVERNIGTWRELKEVDDEVIALAATQLGLCGEGFLAISNRNFDEVNRIIGDVRATTERVNGLVGERKRLLEKLGY